MTTIDARAKAEAILKGRTERRTFRGDSIQLRADGAKRKITGYAAVFNQRSLELGWFIEEVLPGAFKNSIARGDDVRALVEHDPARIVARTKSKTLTVKEDAHGLHIEADVAETSVGDDLLRSIERGDLDQMSFAFRVVKSMWRDERQSNGDLVEIRQLEEVDLLDVSVVAYPAYPQTEVSLRSVSAATAEALEQYRALRGDQIDEDLKLKIRMAEL